MYKLKCSIEINLMNYLDLLKCELALREKDDFFENSKVLNSMLIERIKIDIKNIEEILKRFEFVELVEKNKLF